MVAGSTAIRPALTRNEARTLLGRAMGLVAVTAGAFALGAYLGRNVAYQWGWLFFIASLVSLVGLKGAAQRSEQAAIPLLFGFGTDTVTDQSTSWPEATTLRPGRSRTSSRPRSLLRSGRCPKEAS